MSPLNDEELKLANKAFQTSIQGLVRDSANTYVHPEQQVIDFAGREQLAKLLSGLDHQSLSDSTKLAAVRELALVVGCLKNNNEYHRIPLAEGSNPQERQQREIFMVKSPLAFYELAINA